MNKVTMICGALTLTMAGFSSPATGHAEKLNWIVGHWCSESDGARIEELWLRSSAGTLLGVNHTVAGERTRAFEYLRIVTGDDQRTSYVAQPGGRAPTEFQLVDQGRGWVRFENPEHDFPQRIEYRRDGQTLVAEISGPGREGAQMAIPFEFKPCQP